MEPTKTSRRSVSRSAAQCLQSMSGIDVTPGHTVSSGVPRVRKILNSWSISESPGNKALLVICTRRKSEARGGWYAEGSRQAEVGELDLPLGVDEQVLWLQVSVKNPVRMAEGETLQQLEEVTLQTQEVQRRTQIFTLTRGSGMPVTEEESMNFFRS
ncbi:hypothetical protein INR49_009350 [Caranx melampygus]|nr:hypothetical protein INR49_009350 [Caranx melampygus]